MVALSLYRGNLHRVPDVPRRWLMPTRKISAKDFKILLHRRSKALSRLRSSSSSTTTASDPNPNPNPNSDTNLKQEEDAEDNVSPHSDPKSPQLDQTMAIDSVEASLKESSSDGRDGPVGELGNQILVAEAEGNLQDEKPVAPENPNTDTEACQISNKTIALTAMDQRKIEIEEKLQILNAKKHNLVQVLKQILNTEEELKKRNGTQGLAVRQSVPFQGDVSNDSGSMTRHATPRFGTEGNLGGDTEAGEADEVSKENIHSRHLIRTSSASPSSESPHRRSAYLQHNAVVPHPSRANLAAVSGSPSRFAPPPPGHHMNLPTVSVSVSGTNYIASSPSPSPAASGGTSAFRDNPRLPSPWN